MDIFRIEGPVQLSGSVTVNGSKNAALPIMAACILAAGKSTILSVPNLSDISVCCELLTGVGCKVQKNEDNSLSIDATTIDNPVGDYEIVRQIVNQFQGADGRERFFFAAIGDFQPEPGTVADHRLD